MYKRICNVSPIFTLNATLYDPLLYQVSRGTWLAPISSAASLNNVHHKCFHIPFTQNQSQWTTAKCFQISKVLRIVLSCWYLSIFYTFCMIIFLFQPVVEKLTSLSKNQIQGFGDTLSVLYITGVIKQTMYFPMISAMFCLFSWRKNSLAKVLGLIVLRVNNHWIGSVLRSHRTKTPWSAIVLLHYYKMVRLPELLDKHQLRRAPAAVSLSATFQTLSDPLNSWAKQLI